MAEQFSLFGVTQTPVRCVVIGKADRLDIATAHTVYLGCAVHGSGGIMHGDPGRTLARVQAMVDGRGPDARSWDGVVRIYTSHTPDRDEWLDLLVGDIVSVRLTGGGHG